MSTERFRLVVVSAGTSDPSSTRLLADRTAERVTALECERAGQQAGRVVEIEVLVAADRGREQLLGRLGG